MRLMAVSSVPAALAGSGLGEDVAPLDEEHRTRWRTQSSDWLKADLAVWARDAARPAIVLVTHHLEEIPPGFTHALVLKGGVGDFTTEEARLQRRDHAAQRLDAVEIDAGLLLHLPRQRFDEEATAQRVHGVRNTAFVRDDLLRPQGQSGGKFRGQRPGFIERICVQRLRSAHYCGKRLDRRAHHIVVRLLCRK